MALSQEDRTRAFNQVLSEAWRLGDDAPVTELLPFMEDTNPGPRLRAAYSLGRLRAAAAGNRMLLELRDPEAYIRSLAALALTRSYADSAGLAPSAVADLLLRAAEDPSPAVRINAIRSLGSYTDPALASGLSARLALMLNDQLAGVQVQAAETLGELGGEEAVKALVRAAGGKGTFALRRAALVALGRSRFRRVHPGGGRAGAPAATGATAPPPRRVAALAGPGRVAGVPGRPRRPRHRRGPAGVGGRGRGSRRGVARGRPAAARARGCRRAERRGRRGGRAADPADLTALARMYAATGRDSFPEAALSALDAILAIRKTGPAAQARVDREFLLGATRPQNYLLRRWAADNWPEAAARWGPVRPIATGRSLQDYRDLVRRYLTGPDSLARPHVIIETEGRGFVEVELLGPDAPLTVDNFLRLVDRRFFDRNRWHRVVPNFVVQDGDPRGDGFGSPGGAIRDEINRNRYDAPKLGMALSGPDTGMSQWFINLTAQPHLDGTYTVFGKVVGGAATLVRIAQGDVIRTVARK